MFAPGESDVASYERLEIRAMARDEIQTAVTLAAPAADIKIGTILGMVTTTGLYVPYDNTKTDGSEVARCILAESVCAGTAPLPVSAYIDGVFYKDRLIGLDAPAIADLFMREPVTNIVIL